MPRGLHEDEDPTDALGSGDVLMPHCNDWWVSAPIIGTVTTKPIRNRADGKIFAKSSKHQIVQITESSGHRFYITNESYEPERKCEPLVIVDILVKKYKPRRK